MYQILLLVYSILGIVLFVCTCLCAVYLSKIVKHTGEMSDMMADYWEQRFGPRP